MPAEGEKGKKRMRGCYNVAGLLVVTIKLLKSYDISSPVIILIVKVSVVIVCVYER